MEISGVPNAEVLFRGSEYLYLLYPYAAHWLFSLQTNLATLPQPEATNAAAENS